jgi:hypothetical protein
MVAASGGRHGRWGIRHKKEDGRPDTGVAGNDVDKSRQSQLN